MKVRIKSKQWVLDNSFHYRVSGMSFRVLEVLYPENKYNEFRTEGFRVVCNSELDQICEKFGTLIEIIQSGSDDKYAVVEIGGKKYKLPQSIYEEVEEEQLSLF